MPETNNHLGTVGRLVHIDLARAIMLLLGIPFHISEAYRINYHWYVASPQSSLFLTVMSAIIHSFRMPALFLLSGCFASIVVARKGLEPWIRQRFSRLVVPLVATSLCLGILEVGLADHWRTGLSMVDGLESALAKGPTAWIMHRWFLVVLWAYCLLFAVWHKIVARMRLLTSIKLRLESDFLLVPLLTIIGLASAIAGKAAGPVLGETGRFYVVALIRYAPMFVIGAWVGRRTNNLDSLLQLDGKAVAAGILSLSVYVVLFIPSDLSIMQAHAEFAVKRYAFPIFEPVAGWYVSILFLGLIRSWAKDRFPQGLPASIRLLVDNAMAIYLLHMVVVIIATGLLLGVSWSPVVEFLVATLGSAFVCIATVLTCRGRSFYDLIFNGRRRPAKP